VKKTKNKSKKQKGPFTLVPVERVNAPLAGFSEDWREMRPSWRISLMEMVDPFGWHAVTAEEALQVRARLAGLESMTWKQILYEGGYRNHFIPVERICNDAKERLRQLNQDDIDSVMSLGVTQICRVYGIMEHNILKVLWWDPNHLVCPVAQPNT
jgi:hypothetical protein